MTLRDLVSLKEILENKINLGLDIGTTDVLSEFSSEIKARNFIYSLGIDLIKNGFSSQKRIIKLFRNNAISILNKNNFAKNIFFNLADKGLNL